MARRHAAGRIPVAPTLLINDRLADGTIPVAGEAREKAQAVVAERDANFAGAAAAGVRFVLGTDANGVMVRFGDQHEEVRLMADMFGWSAERALVSATSDAADAIGMGDRVGRLAAGLGADFVVVDGRPGGHLSPRCRPHRRRRLPRTRRIRRASPTNPFRPHLRSERITVNTSPQRRVALAAGSAIALTALLAGCTGGGGGDAAADGTLVFAVETDPTCIDPQQPTVTQALYIGRQVVDSLVDQDPETGEIVPWLAEDFSSNDDMTAFEFTLRDGVTFSDDSELDERVRRRRTSTRSSRCRPMDRRRPSRRSTSRDTRAPRSPTSTPSRSRSTPRTRPSCRARAP